jgi:RNA polymerase sigma factor (sigma-70 family)
MTEVGFERQRPRLRAVAYRMLGSLSDADDAVQETWLRLAGAEATEIANLDGWLTTVLSRVCLNMLRSRRSRREEPLDDRLPDPVLSAADGLSPEHQVLVADAVGLALMVVLDSLGPAERLAFVLHDLFAVPFDEIAPLVGRTAAATRQLASRARRRVRAQAPAPDPDPGRQRAAVDAFFAAARAGDLDALVAVLDPEVVLRSDGGDSRARRTIVLRGARTVAEQAVTFTRFAPFVRPVLVNGAAGVVVAAGGRVLSVMAFTVTGDRIVAIDVLADPDRLTRLTRWPA